MNPVRLVVLAASVLWLPACPRHGGGHCTLSPTNGTQSQLTVSPLNGSYLTVGVNQLPLSPEVIGMCDDGTVELPEAVDVEVTGPDGLPVQAEASGLTSDSGSTTVTFTATVPGWHHLTANFLPTFGLTQVDALVSAEPETASDHLVGSCRPLFRTGLGTLICGASVSRGGTVVQTLPAANARWAFGNVLWENTGDSLRRRVDTGTGALAVTGQLAGSWTGVNAFATETELLVRNNFSVTRVVAASDGTLSESWTSAVPSGDQIFRRGDFALLNLSATFPQELAAYRIDPVFGMTRVGDTRPMDQLLGVSDEGVWVRSGALLRVFVPESTGVVSAGSTVLPGDVSIDGTLGAPQARAFGSSAGVAVFAKSGSGIVLQHFTGDGLVIGTGAGYVYADDFFQGGTAIHFR